MKRVHGGSRQLIQNADVKYKHSDLITRFQSGAIPPAELYTLNHVRSNEIASMRVSDTCVSVTFSKLGKRLASAGLVAELLERITVDVLDRSQQQRTRTRAEMDDRPFVVNSAHSYQLTLDSPETLDYPISSAFQNTLSFDTIFERLAAVSQSAKNLQFADDINLSIFTRRPEDLRRQKAISFYNHDVDKYLSSKKYIYNPDLIQDLLQRRLPQTTVVCCMTVAMTLCEFPDVYKHTKKNVRDRHIIPADFINLVHKLQNCLNVEAPGVAKPEHYQALGASLLENTGRQLVIIKFNKRFKYELVFCFYSDSATAKPDMQDNTQRVYVLAHKGHAYAIVKPNSVLPSANLCVKCGMLRALAGRRLYCLNRNCYKRTVKSCKMCSRHACLSRPTLSSAVVFCDQCNFFAKDIQCLTAHLHKGVCVNNLYRCLKCYRTVENTDELRATHSAGICPLHKCVTCGVPYDLSTPDTHTCYITPSTPTFNPDNTVYFDCETWTDAGGKVQTNCICCVITCKLCRDNFQETVVSCCGIRRRSFFGDSCVTRFITEIVLSTKYRNFLLIAHYLARFDGIILLEELVRMEVPMQRVISRGMKLISLVVGLNKCHLRDSYLLYPCSLSKFCETMNVGMDKDWCPILYNSATALAEPRQPRPPAKRYFVVPPGKQGEFDKFYATIANRPYYFKRELVKYCMRDVVCLWAAAEKFRKRIADQLGIINIYASALTTATAAVHIFRSKFLKRGALAVFHEHCALTKNSAQAYKYMEWLNCCHNYQLEHGANQPRERRIAGWLVDGYDRHRRIVVEYMGCEVTKHTHALAYTHTRAHAHIVRGVKACVCVRVCRTSNKRPEVCSCSIILICPLAATVDVCPTTGMCLINLVPISKYTIVPC
jgi:hypothetical protein